MAEAMLDDDAARRRAAGALDARLFVEAGAGSGKTSVLVARVLELVATGAVEISQVAAITFTEAAAAELRERIHRALEERRRARPDDALVAAALVGLDDAAITTIHGFARRILVEHPLESGLPLEIEILDEIGENEERSRRFRALLDALAERGEDRLLTASLLALGVTDRHLAELARAVDARYDALDRIREASGRAPGLEGLGELVSGAAGELEAARARLGGLAEHCTSEGDRLGAALRDLAAYRSAPASAPLEEAIEWIEQLPLRARPPRAGKDHFSGVDLAALEADYRSAIDRRDASHRAISELVLRALLDRLLDESLAAAEDRRRAGRIGFHDLLVLARRLVVTHPLVRARLAGRYRAILVDEFQDTDPLQLELVEALVADGAGSGRLFLVGDPRQAIYRFRGADLALYERARATVGEGERLELVTNFRSVPGILHFVNESLEHLAARGPAAGLVAHRAALGDRAPVVVLGGPLAAGSAADRRRLQAEELAAAICTIVAERWPVSARDADAGGAVPARLGDIAILLPNRTGLSILERELAARAIRYRIESPQLTYATREVQDLLSVIWALVEPGSERAVLAALRSGVFGCSDEELLAHRRGGGEWRLVFAPATAPEGRVGDALEALGALALDRFERRPVEVLERLLATRRLRQVAATATDPIEATRRTEFLLGEAAAFASAGGRGLAAFYHWARRRADEGQRASEVHAHDPDAVLITTIHGAKGLEFPIVVMSELGGQLARPLRGAQVLLDDGEVALHVLKGLETENFAALAEDERARGVAEALRLGYVGLTRARDHLVVCVHHPAPRTADAPPASLAALLHGIVERRPELARRLEEVAPGPLTPARPAGAGLDEAGYRSVRARLQALSSRASAPRSIAASGLGEDGYAPLAHEGEDAYRLDALSLGSRRDASAVGRATHAVLERLDLFSLEGLDELVERACAAERCPAEAPRVRELAARAATVEVLRDGQRAARAFRELPVVAPIAGGVLEGIVDLCYLDDDGRLVVVDYKTDAVDAPDALAARRAHYELQLGAYALALECATGLAVARLVLVFLAPASGPRSVELDVEAARRSAAEALAATFRPGTTDS